MPPIYFGYKNVKQKKNAVSALSQRTFSGISGIDSSVWTISKTQMDQHTQTGVIVKIKTKNFHSENLELNLYS